MHRKICIRYINAVIIYYYLYCMYDIGRLKKDFAVKTLHIILLVVLCAMFSSK